MEKIKNKDEPLQDDRDVEIKQKERTIRGLTWFIVCTSLYTTCFLYSLDTTIAADIRGPVIRAFGQIEQFV